MPDTQLILFPFHDDIDAFCGWCPDCGLEQLSLVIDEVRSCNDCACEFTFDFKQLERAGDES